jgi:biotin operon repressor
MESRSLKPISGARDLKIVSIPKNLGHGKIPRGWFNGNKFIESLTPSERWVLACLVAYVWRVAYEQKDNPAANTLAYLYRDKEQLVTLMSQRTIAEKCGLNRSTVCAAIDKLDDSGAAIRISGNKGKDASNLYILGYESRGGTKGEKRSDRLFSESLILRNGGKIPEDIKETIRNDRARRGTKLWMSMIQPYNEFLGALLFSPISPLVPKREPEEVILDTQEGEDLL